jgi:phosphopantetheinyl transferase (holo-ACP synthase)
LQLNTRPLSPECHLFWTELPGQLSLPQENEIMACCASARKQAGFAYLLPQDRWACWTVGWLLVQAHQYLQKPYHLEQNTSLTSGQPLGLDVEVWSTPPDWEMAAEFLTAEEWQFGRAQATHDRQLFLRQSWLYKEAFLKMCGQGFKTDPTTISSLISPSQQRPEIQIWRTQWNSQADVTVVMEQNSP